MAGQIGASPVSLKGDGPWRGMTTKSKALPFHFELLENCYVSSDGMEIRTFPGWKCVVDPVTTARTATMTPAQTQALGYERTTIDGKRPFKVAGSGSTDAVYYVDTAPTETMVVWSQPTHVHGVEQVRGRWVFFGESGDRFEQINDAGSTAYVRVTSYVDNGTDCDLTLSAAPNTTANSFNALRAGGGDEITLSGLTGTGATALNNKRHTVISVVGAVVKIDTTIPAGAVAGQSAFISRVTPKGGMVANTGNTDISDDEESLTTWTCTNGGSVTSLTEIVYSAFVANRHRDFGDSTGSIKEGNSFSTNGQSRRRQKVIPYRIVPHVAGNRLVLVAPGYSCVFQAPMLVPINYDENDNTFVDSFSGVGWFGNDIYDKPRAMGLPKAVCYEDPDKDVANTYHVYEATAVGANYQFGGAGGTAGREGVYKFKFAYKDDATGDVGLCSEPISITTTNAVGAVQGLRFLVMFPGYLMHETLAMSVNVYRTEKNGSTFYFDRTIPMASFTNAAASGAESARYGLTPNAADANYYYHAQYNAIYQADAQLVLQQGDVPDSIEQMPRGAKCSRTIRGWTFYGGSLGNTGNRLELLAGNMSLVYDRPTSGVNSTNYNYDELTSRGPGVGITSSDGGFGCSATGIPTAYVGEFVFSRTLLPYPRQLAQINKVVNTDAGYPGGFPFVATLPYLTDVRYQILDTPLRAEAKFSNPNRPTLLVLPRGRIQISEPDHPSVVPATNSTVIANELDEDIEGIGDMGGQAVICSRNKTYMLGFSQTPVGVPAEIASDRFGCIAPNSMVEFDGGCAWLSDRGPCAMIGGSVQWIGEPLEEWFIGETSRYLRDSQGMMRHSWACHDAERGLIYFGVFADRAKVESSARTVTYRGTSYTWDAATALGAGTGDEIRSRFPCDEVLVYSYKVGAWSVWRPPVGMEIKWMTRGQDALGNSRVFFLGVDNRLYVLDDTYGMFNRDCVKNAAAATSTGTTITLLTPMGQTISDIGASETYWRAGMPVLVMSPDGLTVRGTSTVNTISGTTLTTDTAIPVTSGDIVIVGARVATIKTNYINLKGSETASVAKAGMRYGLRNRYSAQISGATTTALAGAKVQIVTNRQIDGAMTAVTAGLTNDTAAAQYTALAAQGAQAEYSLERSFALGRAQGINHRLEMVLVGSAQVRMSDLYVEVQ